MKFERDALFESEVREFSLRYTCEECCLWDPQRDRCSSGFRTAAHRREGPAHRPLLFCKEFEAV